MINFLRTVIVFTLSGIVQLCALVLPALNRLLAVLLFAALAAGAGLFLGCLEGWVAPHSLGLYWHVQGLLDQGLALSQANNLAAVASCAAILVVALFLVWMEISTLRPERNILLHRTPAGATTLDLVPIADLVRWVGLETDGVEGMPRAAVRRRGKFLVVTGRALLNPFVDAHQTGLLLQNRVEMGVTRATGMPVRVRFRTRLQDPRTPRRPR